MSAEWFVDDTLFVEDLPDNAGMTLIPYPDADPLPIQTFASFVDVEGLADRVRVVARSRTCNAVWLGGVQSRVVDGLTQWFCYGALGVLEVVA